jgi:hypothetical protein
MKTWQGLKHLEENSFIKQEDSYRFKAEANPNKKFEGLIKEDYNSEIFRIIDQQGLYKVMHSLLYYVGQKAHKEKSNSLQKIAKALNTICEMLDKMGN